MVSRSLKDWLLLKHTDHTIKILFKKKIKKESTASCCQRVNCITPQTLLLYARVTLPKSDAVNKSGLLTVSWERMGMTIGSARQVHCCRTVNSSPSRPFWKHGLDAAHVSSPCRLYRLEFLHEYNRGLRMHCPAWPHVSFNSLGTGFAGRRGGQQTLLSPAQAYSSRKTSAQKNLNCQRRAWVSIVVFHLVL